MRPGLARDGPSHAQQRCKYGPRTCGRPNTHRSLWLSHVLAWRQPRSASEPVLRYAPLVRLTISFDREEDGRFIAAVDALPGVMAYGATLSEAASKAIALATEVLLDEVANGEREAFGSLEIVGLGTAA